MMTAREELIQAIERSPDDLVQALLELFKRLQQQRSVDTVVSVDAKTILERMEGEPKHILSVGEAAERNRRTWQLCDQFAVTGNVNSAASTNYAEGIDEVLYQGF
jgi:hypothetical protein